MWKRLMLHGNILPVLEGSSQNTALMPRIWVIHSYFAIEIMLLQQAETILGLLVNLFYVLSGFEIWNHLKLIVIINISTVSWQYHHLDTSSWQILSKVTRTSVRPGAPWMCNEILCRLERDTKGALHKQWPLFSFTKNHFTTHCSSLPLRILSLFEFPRDRPKAKQNRVKTKIKLNNGATRKTSEACFLSMFCGIWGLANWVGTVVRARIRN